MSERVAYAAASLRQAFDGPRLLDLTEEGQPLSEEEAYAVQTAVLGDEAPAGWKVAPSATGAYRCAPLGTSRLLPDGGALPDGLCAPLIEVELAIRIVREVPDGADEAGIMAALGPVSMALEILDSRFVDRKAVSPLAALADAQSNRAFVVGSSGAPWPEVEFATTPLQLLADDRIVAETSGGASSAAVRSALVWLAGHAAARGMALRAGQVVITGARLGPLPLPVGRRLVGVGSGVGEVALILNNPMEENGSTT